MSISNVTNPHKPLISIVTVVYNGEDSLEETIQSVMQQTYPRIEYIVIDGQSTDRTVDIIRKYEAEITHWISEPDAGIYDAMNKGNRLATGDYLLMLNSGDYLLHKDAIKELLKLGYDHIGPSPIIAAQAINVYEGKVYHDWLRPIDEQDLDLKNPHHQASFVHKSLYEKFCYRDFYQISGDADYWEQMRKADKYHYKFVNKPVTVFRLGGISNDGRYPHIVIIECIVRDYVNYGTINFKKALYLALSLSLKTVLIKLIGKKRFYGLVLYNTYRLRVYCKR